MKLCVWYALLATLGTWLVSALGATAVLMFKSQNERATDVLTGFAAGVMLAASFWSLLQPAAELAAEGGGTPWLVVTGGFCAGAGFMIGSQKAFFAWKRRKTLHAPRRNAVATRPQGPQAGGLLSLISITLHNIPEGLAVGVAFGALEREGYAPAAVAAAVGVAVGIGLQNFPEGAAVAFPLRRAGLSRGKSFFIGQASGFAEVPAGVIGAAAVGSSQAILPCALAFAAGAMVLVTVHELLPDCQRRRGGENAFAATLGALGGFALMTAMDVGLG